MDASAKSLVAICHQLYQRGLVSGSGGNVSLRVEDGFLITPAGLSLGSLTENQLARVDLTGRALFKGRPSKESPMHLAIYQAREDVKAIVHTHSPHATALTCLLGPGWYIPPYTPGYAYLVRHLPLVPYHRPGSQALADAIRKEASLTNGLLLQNHGVVALGTSLAEALSVAEEIEDNCRIYLLTQGQARSLSSAEVEEIRKVMG